MKGLTMVCGGQESGGGVPLGALEHIPPSKLPSPLVTSAGPALPFSAVAHPPSICHTEWR